MKLLVGTSGYSYKQWKGNFYPEELPNKDMLSHYAKQLPTVEINNTFYRLPKENVLASWLQQVPGHFFRFAIKASQRITHIKRLKDAEDPTEYLFRVLGALGQTLGSVLFQLPPNMKKDLQRLGAFLDLIPKGADAAFEFRHASWFEDDVFQALSERGCALVVSEDEKTEAKVTATSDWGYVRLHKPQYSDSELQRWAEKLGAQPWKRLFVYFKHEDAGAAPMLAQRLTEIM